MDDGGEESEHRTPNLQGREMPSNLGSAVQREVAPPLTPLFQLANIRKDGTSRWLLAVTRRFHTEVTSGSYKCRRQWCLVRGRISMFRFSSKPKLLYSLNNWVLVVLIMGSFFPRISVL